MHINNSDVSQIVTPVVARAATQAAESLANGLSDYYSPPVVQCSATMDQGRICG